MSFFIRKHETGGHGSGKKDEQKRKRKQTPERQPVESSSSEDEAPKRSRQVSTSSDDGETPQEKKLRLAKFYLAELQEQERLKRKTLSDEGAGVSSQAIINKRLRDDYLRSTGKVRSLEASNCVGAAVEDIKLMKSKFHNKTVTCLCVTSDGKIIFSGCKGGNVIKWSVDQMKQISVIVHVKQNPEGAVIGHTQAIMGIAVTHDTKFLAICDETKDIQIWNPQNLMHIKTLFGHRDIVFDLVFRKDSYTLYSCGKDKSVNIWSLNDMAYVETLFGHDGPVMSIDALTRERAVTSGKDSTVRMWKIPEESQLMYSGQGGSIDVVKLLTEDTFISGGDDGTLYIWGINKKRPLCTIPNAHGFKFRSPEAHWITSIACLHNTDLIATGSEGGFIILWRLADSFRTCNILFQIPVVGYINSLTFTPDGQFLIAGVGREHKFGRWNVAEHASVHIAVIPLLKAN